MRLPRNSKVLVNLTDGSSIQGTVVFTWRWWVIKLTAASMVTPQGEIVADGYMLIPARSVVSAQVGI